VFAYGCKSIACPDHNEWFGIHTIASDTCIIQERRPVAYFFCKLTMSQQNYTTLEKEILSIIATLKKYFEVCSSKDIHVFTEHKNLMFVTLKTQCMLRWQTKIEQFSPLDVIGPLQYSSQQLFKAPLPGYSDSDCGGEETRRARRGV
jgi:hypothetical protein